MEMGNRFLLISNRVVDSLIAIDCNNNSNTVKVQKIVSSFKMRRLMNLEFAPQTFPQTNNE